MSVTITPQVQVNASMAQSACDNAREFSSKFNREADERANKAAAGLDLYSDAWYAAYSAAYDVSGREEWVDQQMVLAGFAGWSLLGQGAFRIALLGPDGYVYKIGDVADNKLEATISEALHSVIDGCPKGFRILDMKIVGEVLVTELVPPQPDDSPYASAFDHPEWNEFRNWAAKHDCGIADTHDGNLWWDGEAMVVIDMGNWYYKGQSKWAMK